MEDASNASDASDASDADITEEDAALRSVAQDAQNKQQTFESNKRLKKSIQPASSDKGTACDVTHASAAQPSNGICCNHLSRDSASILSLAGGPDHGLPC